MDYPGNPLPSLSSWLMDAPYFIFLMTVLKNIKKTYLSYSVAKCIHINNSIKCCSRINFVLDIRESAVVIWATSSFVLKSISIWHNVKFQFLTNLTNCITQLRLFTTRDYEQKFEPFKSKYVHIFGFLQVYLYI